jgi:hypothetical protein
MYPAARVDDEVLHEAWETAQAAPIGLAGGIVITIAIIASGGTAVIAFGIGGAVAAIGGLIDTVFVAGDCKIISGADTVFTNLKASALAHPKCKTSDGHEIVRGAEHVFIEDSRASRVGDFSDCEGHISTGSPPPNQVAIGGAMQPRETPMWFIAYQLIDFGYSAASLRANWSTMGTFARLYESGSLALSGWDKLTGESIPGSEVKSAYDTGNSLKGGYDSLRDFLSATPK